MQATNHKIKNMSRIIEIYCFISDIINKSKEDYLLMDEPTVTDDT